MPLLCSLISMIMVTVDWNGPCQSREGHLMEYMSRQSTCQNGRRMCERIYPPPKSPQSKRALIPTRLHPFPPMRANAKIFMRAGSRCGAPVRSTPALCQVVAFYDALKYSPAIVVGNDWRNILIIYPKQIMSSTINVCTRSN